MHPAAKAGLADITTQTVLKNTALRANLLPVYSALPHTMRVTQHSGRERRKKIKGAESDFIKTYSNPRSCPVHVTLTPANESIFRNVQNRRQLADQELRPELQFQIVGKLPGDLQ